MFYKSFQKVFIVRKENVINMAAKKNARGGLDLILLRDHSEESREAAKALDALGVQHSTIFCDPEEPGSRLPALLAPDVPYHGLNNIRWFAGEVYLNQFMPGKSYFKKFLAAKSISEN